MHIACSAVAHAHAEKSPDSLATHQPCLVSPGVTLILSVFPSCTGRPPSLFRRKDNKGTISASNDHFAGRAWGEFQDKHIFSGKEFS